MSATIKVMPDFLKNQIAAGEVVERPASLVKELVENSMDAGARRIVVEFADGGKRLIRVVDDGCGMTREDALMAVERHATSKLTSIEELRNIRTFGFRGEALPSIASVSKFTLKTRTHDEPVGTEIQVSSSGELTVSDAAMAPGTEVTANELFYNVPARRKFLKRDATEAKAIVEVVQKIALCNHLIHFELVNDGRKVISAPPENDMMGRIYGVLGKKVCKHLYECFLEGRISVSGFISDPEYKTRGAGKLYTFVNNRFVRDKVIIQAVSKAYSTLLGRGEYPCAVLNISVPPGELDVNVHPTKNEVRFAASNEVFSAVSRAVRLTLEETPWVSQELAAGHVHSAVEGPSGWGGRAVPENEPELEFRPAGQGSARYTWEVRDLPGHLAPEGEGRGAAGAEGVHAPALGFTGMTYLGQFANCFLLGQSGDRLVVVDQHAAHERVMFERLKEQFENSKVASQPLLVPVLLELGPSLVAEAEAKSELLERLGFHVEPFGGNTVAVKAAPVLLGQRSPETPLLAVLDELAENQGLGPSALFHKTISTMACHSAVRAGDPMAPEEVLELLRQMDSVDLAAYCPHGRPVVVFFPESEVARWFKRT